MEGYIKLYRKIRDSCIWHEKEPFDKRSAWIDLILSANHEDKSIMFGNQIILVERGSFITSITKLAEKWHWSRTKTRAFLEVLKQDSMIDTEKDIRKTTVKVLNYRLYQSRDNTKKTEEKTEEKTVKRQSKDSQKTQTRTEEQKNEKNIYFIRPTLDEIQAYCKERNNKVDPQRFIDFYQSNGWMVGKNKMKDWKATIRGWEQRDTEKKKVNHNFMQHDYDMAKLQKMIEEE